MTRLEQGTIIEIESTAHFLELTNKFDCEHGTTTRIAYLTFKEIWDYFVADQHGDFRYWANTIEEYIHKIILTRLHNDLEDGGFRSNSPNANRSCMGKFNALDQMRNDILSGRGIVHPISVLCLPNRATPVHPGETRMMFTGLYTPQIPTVITVVNGAQLTVKSDPIESIEYDFSDKRLSFTTGMTDNFHMSSIFNKAATSNYTEQHAYYVKVITDYLNNSKQLTYHKPEDLDPPRQFERIGNEVLVDGKVIVRLDNDTWRVVL